MKFRWHHLEISPVVWLIGGLSCWLSGPFSWLSQLPFLWSTSVITLCSLVTLRFASRLTGDGYKCTKSPHPGIWYPTIPYQWVLLDTNLVSWTTCSEHNSGEHPSSSISKWMKCSNKCQRMRTQALHVKTDTENNHQPFPWLFPKCILQICGSYPAGVPSPGCFPRDCPALYGLPRFAFVCLLVILVPSAVPSLCRACAFSQKIRDGNFRVLFPVRRWSLFCDWGYLFKSSVQLKGGPVYEIK